MGLTPTAFWSLSLKEWRWLASREGGSLTSKDLYDLMKEYPDG
ncbi:MAG: phage tail assembly chaperone [Pseudomonadota bacterium]